MVSPRFETKMLNEFFGVQCRNTVYICWVVRGTLVALISLSKEAVVKGGGGHRSATPRTRETYEALYSSAAYRIARSRSAGLYVVTPATTPATTRLGHSRINVLSD